MRNALAVGCGGFFGCIARYLVGVRLVSPELGLFLTVGLLGQIWS